MGECQWQDPVLKLRAGAGGTRSLPQPRERDLEQWDKEDTVLAGRDQSSNWTDNMSNHNPAAGHQVEDGNKEGPKAQGGWTEKGCMKEKGAAMERGTVEKRLLGEIMHGNKGLRDCCRQQGWDRWRRVT
jgi:hypothetical protein